METLKLKDFLDSNEYVCKGIVCKASVSIGTFVQKNGRMGIFEKAQLYILKRKSCSGCKDCGGLWDQLNEISSDWPVEGLNKVKDGKLYQLLIKTTSTDPESGIPDEWNYYLQEYAE